MLNSGLLDIAIDLSAIYFLLSVVCSTINEWIAGVVSKRAAMLEAGLVTMLANPQMARSVLDNPLIRNLAGNGKKPSYVPSQSFSLALIQALVQPQTPVGAIQPVPSTTASALPANMPNIIGAINQLPNGDLKRTLQALLDDARSDYDKFRANVEEWFNSEMDRVSGWYKRWSQIVILVVASIIALVGNVDTVALASRLWGDPPLRSAMAQVVTKDLAQGQPPDQVAEVAADVAKEELPIGWDQPLVQASHSANSTWAAISPWILKLFGLVATLAAVSMGAPTWFDILGKLVNLRMAGDPPSTAS